MPARKRRKTYRGGALSGVAVTLFRFGEDPGPLDLADFHRNPGDVIAQAMASQTAGGKRRRRRRLRRQAFARAPA
jgi:hypothetical protein